jgi:hypothetical protein
MQNDLDTGSLPAGAPAESVDQRRRYMRIGFILFWSGIVLAALLGILGDATRSLSWRLGSFIENLAALGVPVILTGVGVMIYSRLFPTAGASQPALPRAFPYSAAAINAPRQQATPVVETREPHPAASVTEHTTYALDQQRPGERS